RADTGAVVVDRLEVADTAWARLKGLQFRKRLLPGSGLLLVPCPSVHTCFVRFPIDVVLIDRQGTVVAVRRHVRPWRPVLPVRASHATLELPANGTDLAPGVALRLERPGPGAAATPRSLAFLTPSTR